jgi:hypothetical protein
MILMKMESDDIQEEGHEVILKQLAYTPADFAALFGRSQVWGYRQVYGGAVAAKEIGGRAMITRDEILRFMKNLPDFKGRPTKVRD